MLERMYGVTPMEELPPAPAEIPSLSISAQEVTEAYGRFVAEPLERGWGVTLGNPLRRALLSSLSGTAVTWVKIDGVLHEYSTMPHVKEEVGEFLMNIKAIRLRSLVDRPGRLRLGAAPPLRGERALKSLNIGRRYDYSGCGGRSPALRCRTKESGRRRAM
jgi:hypothetical protein